MLHKQIKKKTFFFKSYINLTTLQKLNKNKTVSMNIMCNEKMC